MSNKFSYKDSGVDVQVGDDFVDWIHAENQEMPHKDQVVEGVGGFASLFRLNTQNYKKPCLVTCTDGVGTKVKLAADYQRYEGVGQDLVAMCVNDLLCTGGDPLLFLDYLAVGKLELNQAKAILKSIKNACQQSDLALVGGETAEMPGIYKVPEFDCAGFAVGIVDEDEKYGAHRVSVRDVLIGIPSSGCHSNGYSLLRKVFEKDMDQYKDQLLIPTRLYVQLFKKIKAQFKINAAAHITGGGMDNVPRVIPANLIAKIKNWNWPELFKEVQRRTQVSDLEMLKTLNCGIGMVLVVPEENAKALMTFLSQNGEFPILLGEVVDRSSVNNLKAGEDWIYESNT